ncbi:MAG TPA: hypothetical protein VJQ25_10090 [Nitrospira sp.]|nr:hypothetical protein [Nitrospira sp.]
MIRFIVVLLFAPVAAFSQIRIDKLVVPANETYTLTGSDIIVVDTLIMYDSSTIQLNTAKRDNFIHAKHLIARSGARIMGVGQKGERGKDGTKGLTMDGPCIDGTPGHGGTGGSHGDNGTNLFLYLSQLTITGSLTIDLRGSDGGDGGDGGQGGGGSLGTRVCIGGTGGPGGNGGTGGNGGNGGALTISCKECIDAMRAMLGHQFLVKNYAGFGGVGGSGGSGGLAGLGAQGMTSKDGKIGPRGKRGADGTNGKEGSINFERN